MAFRKAFDEILEHPRKFNDSIDLKIVESIASLALSSDQVFSYGAGRSGLVARCFAQRLMHLGLNSFYIGETITPSVNSGDTVLVVSGSGETLSSRTFLGEAKVLGAVSIALTSKKDSSVGKTADYITAVSRLGTTAGFIGAVVDDPEGRYLIQDLKNE